MKTLRWIVLLPVSLLIAFAGLWTLDHLQIHETYSKHHILLSVFWLAPGFLVRATPCALFVASAGIIAPKKKWMVAMIAALLAFMTVLQFEIATISGNLVFDSLSIVAPFFGAAIAAAVVYVFESKSQKKPA